MTGRKKSGIALTVALALALLGWWGLARRRCHQRGAAFAARVEKLRQEAQTRLKPGTKKEDLLRFFAENDFPVAFDHSEASGTVSTSGCSPFGCGSDDAIIGVSVKVDPLGTVQSAPQVVGMYTNCL
jgi:hypothetical protein